MDILDKARAHPEYELEGLRIEIGEQKFRIAELEAAINALLEHDDYHVREAALDAIQEAESILAKAKEAE